MINHPNRSRKKRDSYIDDHTASIIKGMLMRGDSQQEITACFGGRFNSGRIAEIHNSMTRAYDEDEAPLTTRSRSIPVAIVGDLPPPPPYPSPYEILRSRAALLEASLALRGVVQKSEATIAMIERVLG